MSVEEELKSVRADSPEEWMQEVTLVLARALDRLSERATRLELLTRPLPSAPPTPKPAPYTPEVPWKPLPMPSTGGSWVVETPVYYTYSDTTTKPPEEYWGT